MGDADAANHDIRWNFKATKDVLHEIDKFVSFDIYYLYIYYGLTFYIYIKWVCDIFAYMGMNYAIIDKLCKAVAFHDERNG